MTMKPMSIQYRDGKGKMITIKADSVHGDVPAGSSTLYWVYSLKGKQVARVSERHLSTEEINKTKKLYGRPWLQRFNELKAIDLYRYNDWELDLDGYPDNTEQVWEISELSKREYWLIECSDRIILHIMNNDERTVKGEFEAALKKMFPGKPIAYNLPVIKKFKVR